MNLDQLRDDYEHHAGQARAYLAAWENCDIDEEKAGAYLAAAQVHAQLAHGLAVLKAGADIVDMVWKLPI
jgi:hypothetical protein